MKTWLLFIILILTQSLGFGQDMEEFDRLIKKAKLRLIDNNNLPADTVLVKKICSLSDKLRSSDAAESLIRIDIAIALAKKLNFKKGIGDAYRIKSGGFIYSNQLDSSLIYLQKAIAIAKNNDFSYLNFKCTEVYGNYYYFKSDYDSCFIKYYEADAIAEKDFPEEMGSSKGNLGFLFRVVGNNLKAEEYLTQSIKYSKIYKDTSSLLFSLNNMGIVCKNNKDFEAAISNYEEGLEIAILTKNLRRESEIYYNLCNLYFILGESEKGLKYLEMSSEITKIIGTDRDMALEYYNLALRNLEFKKYNRAVSFANMGLELGKKTNFIEVEIALLDIRGNAFARLNQFKKAFYDIRRCYSLTDSLAISTTAAQASELEQQITVQKNFIADSLDKVRVNEIHALELQYQEEVNQEQIKRREYLIYGVILIVLLVALGLINQRKKNKLIKAKNTVIENANSELKIQKDEIEEQHKEITESINYAKRIQDSFLPTEEKLTNEIPQSFLFFLPKDIVSGDFYWYEKINAEETLVAVADCTGHGVPGAIMSVICSDGLNYAVNEKKLTATNLILDHAKEYILKKLKTESSQTKDGMDIALCKINSKTKEIEFSGANNPLWVVQHNENEILEIKGDKQPIGYYENALPFNKHIIKFETGDFVYLFSDGYADQFGGEKGKKFKYKPLKEILIKCAGEKPQIIKNELSKRFHDWKGNIEQVDDVCIIGIQL